MHSYQVIDQTVQCPLGDSYDRESFSERQRYWVDQFLRFHSQTPIAQLDEQHLFRFLDHLSSLRYLSPLHQVDALSALLLLFRRVLKRSVHGLQLHYLTPSYAQAQRWHAVG